MESKYIAGYGNTHAKILILGECPTYDDQLVGKSFSKARETYPSA
jgi:uracil-DNA glycosylase